MRSASALRRAGGLIALLVAVSAPLGASTPPGSAPIDTLYLATEIQQRRPNDPSDPLPTSNLGWQPWLPEQAECRSVTDVLWALAADNDCGRVVQGKYEGEVLKTLQQLYEAGASLHRALDAPEETLFEVLEGIGSAFDFPANVVKCLVKTSIRASQPDGPDRQRQLLRIDALADAISLKDLIYDIKALREQGLISTTWREQAEDLASPAASGATQSKGWLENFAAAAQTFHAGKTAAIELELTRARQRLAQCVTRESRPTFQAAQENALRYVEETRVWAMDVERQVYCEALRRGGLTDRPIDTFSRNVLPSTAPMVASSLEKTLESTYGREREAVALYESVAAEVAAALVEIDKQDEEVDRLVADLETLADDLERTWQSCDQETIDAMARRLARLQENQCLDYASATAGIAERIPTLREKLRSFSLARNAFPGVVRRATKEASEHLEQCRFDEVPVPFDERFRSFDTQFDPFSIGLFRGCWPPLDATEEEREGWPPDRVQEESETGQDELWALVADVRGLMEKSATLRLECEWAEARTAIDEARTRLEETSCPSDAPLLDDLAAEQPGLDELDDLIDEDQDRLGAEIERYEEAARDLLQSLEEELYSAEQPANENRCEAADRVIEMADIARSIVPPDECPNAILEGFSEDVTEARTRALEALELGRAELEALERAGRTAVEGCDLEALTSAIDGLRELPVVCGGDPRATAEAFGAEAARLEQSLDGSRAKMADLERQGAEARQQCDPEALTRFAAAVDDLNLDPCLRSNLAEADLARLDALSVTAAGIPALLEEKRAVEAALLAKLRVGEGYVRILESGDVDGRAALAGAERIRRDAEAYIDFARNYAAPETLPELCYIDDLDQVRSLVPTLERLIARAGVSAPDLVGKSEDLAVAWLEDLDLRAFVQPGRSTADPRKVGSVARQSPAPGAPLDKGGLVTVWIYEAPEVENIPEPATLTQAECSRRWPGTVLRENPGAEAGCFCPSGEAWSRVQHRCLALPGGGGVIGGPSGGGRRCADKPGTLFNPSSGQCDCPIGIWDASQGRCVDVVAAERQKAIDNARTDVGCEYLLSQVRTLRGHPSAPQRQMSASAQARARSMGCDESRITEAVDEGDRRVWPAPTTDGGGGTGRPQVPTLTEEQQQQIRAATVGSRGTSPPPPTSQPGERQGSGDCSRCKPYSDWLEENARACGYHGARLPSICDLDPECLQWNKDCNDRKRKLDECIAECSG